MSDNDFREVIDGEENKEPAASDNNLHTTEAESKHHGRCTGE